MSDALILEQTKRCDTIARRFAQAYPPCEAEDISQDLLMYLCENRESVPEWAASNDLMNDVLKSRATTYCRRERAAHNIIHNAYWYRPEDVRTALASWFSYDNWQAYIKSQGPADGQRIYTSREPSDETSADRTGQVIWHNDKAEGLSVLVDISRCYDRLPAGYRIHLERLYVGGMTDAEVAEMDGIDAGAARMRTTRAIDALAELMNGVR